MSAFTLAQLNASRSLSLNFAQMQGYTQLLSFYNFYGSFGTRVLIFLFSIGRVTVAIHSYNIWLRLFIDLFTWIYYILLLCLFHSTNRLYLRGYNGNML